MRKTEARTDASGLSHRAHTIPYEEVRNRLLANPNVRFEYDKLKIREEVARALAEARKRARLTQEQVAQRAGTRQSVIARLEGGKGGIPSLSLLDRVAHAVGLQLSLRLEPRKAA